MAAPGDGDVVLVKLRRHQNSTSWGFRLHGGIDQNLPLYVQKVTPKSIAHKHGMKAGDAILMIDRSSAINMTHAQAKMEILRAGNELDFTVKTGAIDMTNPLYSGVQEKAAEPRSVVEESSMFSNARPARHVQSKSFQMLSQHLAESESGGERPESIMDKGLEDRSTYLLATDSSFQKTYGEKQ